MKAVKMSNQYTYELFRPNELLDIFQDVWPDLVLVGDILRDPPQIINIYKRFLQHYGASLERVDMQLFSTEYPVHEYHDFSRINIFHFLSRLAPLLKIQDFCPTDVLMPSPKRAKRVLSAIANFVLFTTDKKKEEYVREVNEECTNRRARHNERLEEIDQLTACKNQYLVKREENDAHEKMVDRQLEELVHNMQDVKERKAQHQKEVTRKTEVVADLEHTVQEESAKSNKLAQEEEEYKKLIVKSPESVQMEKNQAQEDLEKVLEKQNRILLNEAKYNHRQVLLDELGEELPFISKVRDQFSASRELSKQVDKIRLERASKKDQEDVNVKDLQSHREANFEREKNLESCALRITNEKKACTEELDRLNSAIAEKRNTSSQTSQWVEKNGEQAKQREENIKKMKTRENAAIKKAEEEKNACIAEADRFDEEVLKMTQTLAKQNEKFHHLKSEFM